MTSILDKFAERLHAEWLPDFCFDPKRNYSIEGFKPESIKVSEHDAANFIAALDSGLVIDSGGGRYRCEKSNAFEQIFWTGSKKKVPRPLTLWVEPVITIATIARLHLEFDWPVQQLGMQSKTWAFDFTACRSIDDDREYIAGEVKKSIKEIDLLIDHLIHFGQEGNKLSPPDDAKRINSYKKWLALLDCKAPYFWAVGPNDYTKLFSVKYSDQDTATFHLVPLEQLHSQ